MTYLTTLVGVFLSLGSFKTEQEQKQRQKIAAIMSKVEDTFMAKAPTDVEDLWWFMDEIPYWTAKKHGKKYRLLYQTTAMSREGSLGKPRA